MTWKDFFEREKQLVYFQDLMDFVNEEYKNKVIYPPKDLIFNAFDKTPFDKVKVVLMGQDPYINENQAMGLAISVPKSSSIPPSLKNIYKEIGNEYDITISQDGDLSYLAEQGVLLLNTTLTVESGKSLSHAGKGYETLTRHIIERLDLDNNPKVFILWGSNARKLKNYINNKKHLVLESAHPSPLGAYKGFFGNNHFIKTNEFLKSHNIEEINWIKKIKPF